MVGPLIGAHMPTGKGLGNALRAGKAIGCTAVQVFTSSPQQWKAKEITPDQVADFQKAREETGIYSVTSHDSYLINLAAPDEELREKSMLGLSLEMVRCATYGIDRLVSHMGAYKEDQDLGCARVAEAALAVLANTPESVTLCMETTAGQGSSLNWKFEQLARILELTGGPARLAVCLDTCHVFAAGYDIRTDEGYDKTFAEFDRLVGLDRLKVIHCNDSKKPLGSRVDRHEAIGKGEIGPRAFERLVKDPRFEAVPILLETPEAETMHEVNLKTLWGLQALGGMK